MTTRKPESWDRLQELFQAALECPAQQRSAFVARACSDDPRLRAEVEQLLAAYEPAEQELESSPIVDTTNWSEALQDSEDLPAKLPERIGRYRIRRVIATGGMGAIYEARQEHPHRTVALKVMRRSMASPSVRRRFQYESELLARLRHPGIAQVFEAGTHQEGTESVPYFAMEYVPDGRPITEYADQQDLGLRQRLELFTQICDAVEYGHQKGVIHRDLKPSNILVDADGQPRVIDFGVARSTDSDVALTTMRTETGQLIGTLQYMSPEQCAADPHNIDTRTDVYSLGAVLYELLSGKPPHDVATLPLHEAIRMIRQERPSRLSSIDARLRGDVETIAAKALETDRQRRYRSVAELADDVRRYLAGEAITARPPSMAYQLRLFARRNKALVGGTSAVIVALTLGVIGTTLGLIQARRRQQEAENVAVLASKVANPYQTPEVKRKLLDELTEMLEAGELFTRNPLGEATLRREIGLTYHDLGELDESEKHLRIAWEIRRRLLGEEDLLVAESLGDLATMSSYFSRMGIETNTRTLRKVLKMRREQLGPEDPRTLRSMHDLAGWLNDIGRNDEAIGLLGDVIPKRRRVLGPDHLDVARSMVRLGFALENTNHDDEAERNFRGALAIQRKHLGSQHPQVASTLYLLGGLLAKNNRPEEAEPLLRDAVAIYQDRAGEGHFHSSFALSWLGGVLLKQGELTEAERWLRKGLQLRDERKDRSTAIMRAKLAECLLQTKQTEKYAEAEELLLLNYEVLKKHPDRPEGHIRETVKQLAALYRGWGKPEKAAQWLAKLPDQRPQQE